ncbi:biotin-dependent carboxyltransferase family protein [Paenibacillus hodogayensis]|uniref:Biotin-dependent carboxyltransferase family protein n=1 Tax=Paenibacillus hodogayensis TaxID=279208 RepID=A0ABV5VTX6_9BACL
MTVTIIRPGLLTTVQDLGRPGFQKLGVAVGGAADAVSLRTANLLVGNAEEEAALELTLGGVALRFEADTLLAVCGADFSPALDGIPFPQSRPVAVRRGSVLEFGVSRQGLRTYVAAAGGFAVPKVMGSASTYTRGGFGGFAGRALQAGDVVPVGPPGERSARLGRVLLRSAGTDSGDAGFGCPYLSTSWFASDVAGIVRQNDRRIIRVLRGEHFERFDADSREKLFRQPFVVDPRSDRMGSRLSGPALQLSAPLELLSEGVSHGTVQVPPDGQPIVLLADRQTTGGYPQIAHVASVDLPAVAQTKPGEQIRFREIGREEAEWLLVRRECAMRELQAAISLKLRDG